MSRSFAAVPTGYYRVRNFDVLDAKLCVPPVQPSRMIPIDINWTDYGAPATANIGVEIILPSQVSDKLGKIGSVYIDNTGSTVPIYVKFPDTGFVITAPPATATWFPVFTNNFQMQVYSLNMTTGFVPTTKLFISNREIGPSIDNEIFNVVPQYIGSTTIQRSNLVTPGFGSPALGDQIISTPFSFTGANQVQALQGTGDVSFYYVTSISVVFHFLGGTSSAAGNFSFFIFQLVEGVTGTVIMEFRPALFNPAAGAFASSLNLPQVLITGANLRLSATNGYLFKVTTWSNYPGFIGALTNWTNAGQITLTYTANAK